MTWRWHPTLWWIISNIFLMAGWHRSVAKGRNDMLAFTSSFIKSMPYPQRLFNKKCKPRSAPFSCKRDAASGGTEMIKACRLKSLIAWLILEMFESHIFLFHCPHVVKAALCDAKGLKQRTLRFPMDPKPIIKIFLIFLSSFTVRILWIIVLTELHWQSFTTHPAPGVVAGEPQCQTTPSLWHMFRRSDSSWGHLQTVS